MGEDLPLPMGNNLRLAQMPGNLVSGGVEGRMKNLILAVAMVLSTPLEAALHNPIEVDRLDHLGNHPGNPEAFIFKAHFNDGMGITFGIYDIGDVPFIMLGGFAGSMGYVHPFLKNYVAPLQIPTGVIQVPGQGEDGVVSGIRGRSQGYEYTAQAMAFMYLQPLLEAMQTWVNPSIPVLLGGHSRGGLILRFYLTGYRFVGWNSKGLPVLARRPEFVKAMSRTTEGLVSLGSPRNPTDDLVWGVTELPRYSEQMKGAQDLSQGVNRLVGAWFDLLSGQPGSGASARRIEDINRRNFLGLILDGNMESLVESSHRVNEALFPGLERAISEGLGTMPYEDLRRAIRLNQDMIASTKEGLSRVDQEAMLHILEHWGLRKVSPDAVEEFKAMANRDGRFQLIGESPEGKPIYFGDAFETARSDSKTPPLHIAHSEGDGLIEQAERERDMDPRSKYVLLPDGHGIVTKNAMVKAADFVQNCRSVMGGILQPPGA